MGEKSAIQWTDTTWNVARGCSKVDEDCQFCYMYRDSFNSTRYNPLEVVRTAVSSLHCLRAREHGTTWTINLKWWSEAHSLA